MDLRKYFAFKTNFKYIAWFLWFLFVANALSDFSGPFLNSNEHISKSDYNKYVAYFLILFALLESGVTFLIRYLALTRPAKKGSYSPYDWPFRFLIVGVINWICSGSIVLYGPVVYYMSGLVWPVIFFGSLGFLLFLFHSPRLGQFRIEPKESHDIMDASFSQIK